MKAASPKSSKNEENVDLNKWGYSHNAGEVHRAILSSTILKFFFRPRSGAADIYQQEHGRR